MLLRLRHRLFPPVRMPQFIKTKKCATSSQVLWILYTCIVDSVHMYCGQCTHVLWILYTCIVDTVHMYCGQCTHVLWILYTCIVDTVHILEQFHMSKHLYEGAVRLVWQQPQQHTHLGDLAAQVGSWFFPHQPTPIYHCHV